jgi:hypothetical protein
VLIAQPIFFKFLLFFRPSKKQQCHLVKACRLRKCEQRVEELSASAVKLIMQRHSQLSEEELVGIQDNHNSNAEF